jgi:hypothetical protein
MNNTPRSKYNCKPRNMETKLATLLSFLALVVAVVAMPVPDGTDTAQDKKYAKDKGASRSVLSYVFGAAGCIALLGVIFFASCKWKRGERVFGMQKKPQSETARDAGLDIQRIWVAKPRNTRKRTVQSMYGTDNPYGWPGRSADPATTGQPYMDQNLNKPLPLLPMHDGGHREHGVKMPAPVARPPQHGGRQAGHVSSIPVIYQNSAGYYNAPL